MNRFFSNAINWANQLAAKGVDKDVVASIGNNTGTYQVNLHIIAIYFDVMTWWHEVGKHECPWIYLVACIVLAVPDSNGHQERTFSTCSWMDDPLKKSQSDATFEMKSLIYRNSGLLKQS